jgi:hypothetical protein
VRISAKQVIMALTSMILTLGVLWAAQRIYHTSVVDNPLVSQLGAIAGVRHADVHQGAVVVTVNRQVDLMSVYQNVATNANTALGHAPARIVIKNNPNPALTALSRNVEFVVAQGEATGQYVAMKKAIENLASQHHAGVSVEMDSHHVYLTFTQHQYVVYDVIPITIGGSGRA